MNNSSVEYTHTRVYFADIYVSQLFLDLEVK